MSAHSASQRRGVMAQLAAQISAFVLEPVEATADSQPVDLQPYPVVAVVSAATRSGATSVARMLAAELAVRADGAAVVLAGGHAARRSAPPSRAAVRLSVALRGVVDSAQPLGRLCLVADPDPQRAAMAAHYLAPVVIDVAPDGSAASTASHAERAVVVVGASQEPALAAALARGVGGSPVVAVNRLREAGDWTGRADIRLPESRIAARAALVGTRPLGALGEAIVQLADALETRR
jgi:hypothetical protein